MTGARPPSTPARARRVTETPVAAKPRYHAHITKRPGDIARARNLRTLAFATGGGDGDRFDGRCDHLLVEHVVSGELVCCARLLKLADARQVSTSYSAQFYDLDALAQFPGRLAEIGRFCIHPDHNDPDILRVAWGAMTRYVDDNKIEMLFGCSSFAGTRMDIYLDTFAMLKDRHIAPARWLPRIKAPDVIAYGHAQSRVPDFKRALRAMPPLLRTYLMMGGWVSDHAVVDHHMNTLHVFTGLEIRAIPESRKRLLRMMGRGTMPEAGVKADAGPLTP